MNNQNIKIQHILAGLHSDVINAYSVGSLLYTPATNPLIYEKIKNGVFDNPYSLCFCLEDSIEDSAVKMGEQNIIQIFAALEKNLTSLPYLPQLFIRVRNPGQIKALTNKLDTSLTLLKGFVLPKFSPDNAPVYIEQICNVNQSFSKKIYMMPILESQNLIPLHTRISMLTTLYHLLMEVHSLVLNIRVGGNDLCHYFGVRRNANESIYDILPVAHILSDILTVFQKDFIVSGPVWEYFADENNNWKIGLEQELHKDLLNGFIGKTVIHPNQIAIVNEGLKANQHDLEDALNILTFENSTLLVEKSSAGTRMNEIKTHTNWALKQVLLSNIYGVN